MKNSVEGEVEVILGGLNGYVGSNTEDCEDQDGECGYGERKRNEEDLETALVSSASGMMIVF